MNSPLTIAATCFPTALPDGAPVIVTNPGGIRVRCRVLTFCNGVYCVVDTKGRVGHHYTPDLVALDLSSQDRGVDGLLVGVQMLAPAFGLDPDTTTWRLVPKRRGDPLESGQYAWLLTDGADGVLFYPFDDEDSPKTDEWGIPALLSIEHLDDAPRWRREALRVVVESQVWKRRAAAKAETP